MHHRVADPACSHRASAELPHRPTLRWIPSILVAQVLQACQEFQAAPLAEVLRQQRQQPGQQRCPFAQLLRSRHSRPTRPRLRHQDRDRNRRPERKPNYSSPFQSRRSNQPSNGCVKFSSVCPFSCEGGNFQVRVVVSSLRPSPISRQIRSSRLPGAMKCFAYRRQAECQRRYKIPKFQGTQELSDATCLVIT